MKTGIYYKEIFAIINELNDNEGYISKIDFQQRIDQLSESVKPKNTPLINNSRNIINDITKYQNKAKLKGFDSSYKKFINRHIAILHLEKIDFSDVKLDIRTGGGFIKWTNLEYYKAFELFEYNFVGSLNELKEILNVTRPTINRWAKLKIPTKLELKARLIIKGQFYYPWKCDWLKFYDLGCIKQGLRELN